MHKKITAPILIVILFIAAAILSLNGCSVQKPAENPEKCEVTILNPCFVNAGQDCILELIVNSNLDKNYSVNGIEAVSNKAFTLKIPAASNRNVTISASDKNNIICSTTFLMTVTKKQTAACGNKECESGENCGNCPDDCACTSGECIVDRCYAVECSAKKDCDDGDVCTTDACSRAGTTASACVNKKIIFCEDDDGCCPGNCNASKDNDC